jgi:hypothetical protein
VKSRGSQFFSGSPLADQQYGPLDWCNSRQPFLKREKSL